MERVSGVQCTVGESPAWDAAQQAWFWVDIPAKRIWRLDAAGVSRYWEVPQMAACIAPRSGGGLIAGMETGMFSVALGEGREAETTLLASPAAGELGEGMRFNDGRTDRQGRFWSGTMFMDMSAGKDAGKLYRYDARGLSSPVVEGLFTQNGLSWSPDGRTMYLSDSHPKSRKVWAFDYDTETGTPTRRREFADLAQHVGRPDGAVVDADGCYWSCANDAGCLLRFTPDGRLDRKLDLPFAKPSMCTFGGADLRTLLVTSIVSGKAEDAEWGGAVVLLRPGVQGLADSPFNG
ncbi:SMP-30/gluconolactonase/LRE family protein [Massilia endophytica]|uniref:SMP-30/gluconolactonase/LRE family protein n=1 Tax=Massilia endophytica TaxID=2899220 RepID=UPI001E5D2136|nr:SMP-30/gluconolactonase/LRE family protein [Massilia endophytica]UGQ45771.1 SMP-30/gluconolactonase/LRE family protein [Massilia endophytica]